MMKLKNSKDNNPSNKKKRCYIYTRVSTFMQVEGYSLDAQKERLLKEAKHRELQVVEPIFSDEGASGKNTTGRPQFQEMMKRIENGNMDKVDYVLVFKLSRFGRNTADVLYNLQLMQDNGVNLLSVEEGIDSAGSVGKLIISVVAAVAEIERENIREQTMAGRRQKAREGRWNGGQAPFGYKINSETGILEIDEEEAAIVRLIFDRYLNYEAGANGVARWLNANGYTKKVVKARETPLFTAHFIKLMLDNPTYIGKIAYGRRKTEKIEGKRNEYHIVKQDEGTYDVWDGQHPAIIDDETWRKVREKREATAVKKEKTHSLEHEHVLSGILKCPLCGSSMYGIPGRKKRKDGTYYENSLDTFYYVCNKKRLHGAKACSFPQINQKVLDREMRFLFKDLWAGGEFDNSMQYALNLRSNEDELKARLEALQENRHKAVLKKNKYLAELDRLDITDAAYEMKYEDTQKRLDAVYEEIVGIDKDIAEVESDLSKKMQAKATKEDAHEFLQQITELWDDLTDAYKKKLVNAWVKEIRLYKKQQSNGAWISGIDFQFPVVLDNGNIVADSFDFPDEEDGDSFPHKETIDETICCLYHLKQAFISVPYEPKDTSCLKSVN